MRRTFATMGTVASLGLGDDDPDLVARVREIFDEFEARFSRFRPDSELSAVIDGRLPLPQSSDVLRDAYATAMDWRAATGGAFTPNRPDGILDLDGIVKAQAIAAAGVVLDRGGASGWTLAVGGDVLVAANGRDEDRIVGVVDPADRTALLTAVRLDGGRRAAATSGSAERGDHIWGRNGTTPEFVQATVLADDIVTADVLATAIVAAGPEHVDEITERWAVDALTVDRAGALRATPGFRAALAA